MAANKSKDGPVIRYDDFVKQVRPDPANTDPVVIVQGYVGASDKDDHIRLYSDDNLTDHMDIPKADILKAVEDNENPLGGSQLWVKQTASVSYNQSPQDGGMYADYMQNDYQPGAENMAGAGAAITQLGCPGPTLTRPFICNFPTRFICPPRTRPIFCPPLSRPPACPLPSRFGACPTWICTIQRTVACAINPGGGGGGFADDYSGGDMYGDYMQNSYDGGASGETMGAGAGITNPPFCYQPVRTILNCPSVVIICQSSPIRCITRPVINCFPPCRFGTRGCANGTFRPVSLVCGNTIACQTDFTIPNPGTIRAGGGFADDYSGGDMYGDYMQNSYDGSGGEEAMGAGITAACTGGVQSRLVICQSFVCPSFRIICQSLRIRCITRPVIQCFQPCQFGTQGCALGTIRPFSQVCGTDFTIHNPGTIRAGGGFADDYSGGDMYGDYMQDTYDGGTESQAAAAQPTLQTLAVVCHAPTLVPVGCPTLLPTRCCITVNTPACHFTNQVRCRTINICPPSLPHFCRTRPPFHCPVSLVAICPRTRICDINPGGMGDAYGGY